MSRKKRNRNRIINIHPPPQISKTKKTEPQGDSEALEAVEPQTGTQTNLVAQYGQRMRMVSTSTIKVTMVKYYSTRRATHVAITAAYQAIIGATAELDSKMSRRALKEHSTQVEVNCNRTTNKED